MTEKRFMFVIDNGEYTFYDLSENGEIMNMIDTEDMLNELNKENEQLKDKYNEQSVQYEGLEEQVERLLDFKDNIFNLINAKIKEYKKYDEYDTEKYYIGTGLLKELKKEIRE